MPTLALVDRLVFGINLTPSQAGSGNRRVLICLDTFSDFVTLLSAL